MAARINNKEILVRTRNTFISAKVGKTRLEEGGPVPFQNRLHLAGGLAGQFRGETHYPSSLI